MKSSSLGRIMTEIRTPALKHVVETSQDKKSSNTTMLLRPFLLGAVDGLITSFVIVAGGYAGNVNKRSILIIGFSSLVADGFSMGVSEYLSTRNEQSLRMSVYTGFACFLSFIVFGCLPLFGFLTGNSRSTQIILSSIFFFISLAILGILHGCFVQKSSTLEHIRRFAEIVILGSVAGGIAFGVASVRLD